MKKYSILQKIALLLILLIPVCGFSQEDSVKFRVKQTDFYFILADGVRLECTEFVPEGMSPVNGWPAMVFCHGYGGNKGNEQEYAKQLAEYGYYTLAYSMRGQGKSGGLSNLISTLEMRDFIELVGFIKKDRPVNPSLVGATGGSQGGTIPFMAACNGLDLACIISDVASPEFATSWMENNSPKMTLLWTLSYDTTVVRYNNRVKRMRDWILSDDPQYWDSLAFYVPLERDFMDRVSSCNTPIMISTAWQDKFFNTRGMIKAGHLLKSPFRMYYGTFDAHGADPYEPEMKYQENITGYWLNYWMGGIQNGVLDSIQYVYAPSVYPINESKPPAMWTWYRMYSYSWPPRGSNDVKFYFHDNGKLSTSSGSGNELQFNNDVSDITLLQAANYEFKGNEFEAKFKKIELIFETEPLNKQITMAGTPSVNLNYICDAISAQYNFQIWEVHPDNTTKLVTRINYTDRKIKPGEYKTASFDGLSHSHIFQQGSKIRIVITNLDNTKDDRFLRTNPHVLPVVTKSSGKIKIEGSSSTYLTLPLVDFK